MSATPQQQLLPHLRAAHSSVGGAGHTPHLGVGSPNGSLGSGGVAGGDAGVGAGSDVASSPSRAASRFKVLSVQTAGLGAPHALGGITHLGSYEVPAQHLAPASSGTAAAPASLQARSSQAQDHPTAAALEGGSPVDTVVMVASTSDEDDSSGDDEEDGSTSNGSSRSSSSSSSSGDTVGVASTPADVVSTGVTEPAEAQMASSAAAHMPPRPSAAAPAPTATTHTSSTGQGRTSRGRRSSSRHSLASAAAAGAVAASVGSVVRHRSSDGGGGDCGASSSYDSEYTRTDSFASDPALVSHPLNHSG
jgi:hypothetical protein